MKIMGAPSKGPVPHSVPLTLQQATANLGLHWRFLALTGKPGSVSCEVTAPFSWVLVHKVLFVPSKSLFPQSCVSSVIKFHWPPKSNSLGVLGPFCQIPRLGNLLWILELS